MIWLYSQDLAIIKLHEECGRVLVALKEVISGSNTWLDKVKALEKWGKHGRKHVTAKGQAWNELMDFPI